MKEKVIVIIDGSNLYYKLKSISIKHTSSYNYQGLVTRLTAGRQLVYCKYYVGVIRTAITDKVGQKLRKQQVDFFNFLQHQQIKIEKGFLMKSAGSYHEIGVDVKMAVDMLVGAYERNF